MGKKRLPIILNELVGQVRSHVNFLAAEVFPQKTPADLLRSISRLRAGGIECILINLPRDQTEKDVHWGNQVGDRFAAQGGKKRRHRHSHARYYD